MDNYGDSVYDNKNNLIGYKINDSEFVSIEIFYDKDNLKYNKVSVWDMRELNLPLKSEALISWVDTQTQLGFVREYKNNKYYYNLNNNLENVETFYSCPSFPNFKKDLTFNEKIGTIDF